MTLLEEINSLGIIKCGRSNFSIKKSLISDDLLDRIITATSRCRDNLTERIYWIMNEIEDYPYCIECGTQFKPRFYGLKSSYQNCKHLCSRKCISSNKEILALKRQTCLERYGVENYRNIEKVYETSMLNYGVEHFSKSKIVKQHTEESNLAKIGHRNYFQAESSKQKSKQTCIEKYGKEFYTQTEECKQKMKATCIERYGVPFAMQDPTFLEKAFKSGAKRKVFELPNGAIHFYQGYEDVALKLLLNEYAIEQITMDIKKVPVIKYDRNRHYYPDFFIASKNLIIEVKSNHTYQSQIFRNIQKANAAVELGFDFQFWICNAKQLKSKIQWRSL